MTHFIWWTTREDCRAIAAGFDKARARWPAYVEIEFRSRCKRTKPGHVYHTRHIFGYVPEVLDVYNLGSFMASHLSMSYAGIMLKEEDVHAFCHLPGFVTDVAFKAIGDN